MCRCYKVCRLCSCTGLVFAGGFLSQPGASKAGRYLASNPFLSYEKPARLLPAVAVASIHGAAEKGTSRKPTCTLPAGSLGGVPIHGVGYEYLWDLGKE